MLAIVKCMIWVQEEHWALQHEAMLALLAFARSPSTDIKAVLPRRFFDDAAGEGFSILSCKMYASGKAGSNL